MGRGGERKALVAAASQLRRQLCCPIFPARWRLPWWCREDEVDRKKRRKKRVEDEEM
jgi:hypothetical protein